MITKTRTHNPSADYDRVARAIEIILERRDEALRLDELAADVGLSPFHFQRLFSRWAGISPKRFFQYLTIDHARRVLREGPSVLDATLEVGLSGPGRLHDLFVSIDAVTPGEFKSGGRDLEIRHGTHPTPFGDCQVGVTERGVCWLSFSTAEDHDDGLRALRAAWPSATLVEDSQAAAALCRRIFGPTPRQTDTPVTLLVRGTNLQLKVWEALIRIPPGRLVTYADVARAVGHPGAARAVGQAVGANPIAYLIPCHRVIRSLGTLGDYRWGATRKHAMIGWEASRHTVRSPVAARA